MMIRGKEKKIAQRRRILTRVICDVAPVRVATLHPGILGALKISPRPDGSTSISYIANCCIENCIGTLLMTVTARNCV
jgi:hypothetical protein